MYGIRKLKQEQEIPILVMLLKKIRRLLLDEPLGSRLTQSQIRCVTVQTTCTLQPLLASVVEIIPCMYWLFGLVLNRTPRVHFFLMKDKNQSRNFFKYQPFTLTEMLNIYQKELFKASWCPTKCSIDKNCFTIE